MLRIDLFSSGYFRVLRMTLWFVFAVSQSEISETNFKSSVSRIASANLVCDFCFTGRFCERSRFSVSKFRSSFEVLLQSLWRDVFVFRVSSANFLGNFEQKYFRRCP